MGGLIPQRFAKGQTYADIVARANAEEWKAQFLTGQFFSNLMLANPHEWKAWVEGKRGQFLTKVRR